MDSLLELREPRRTSRDRAQTIDVLDLSGIDSCYALARKLAWADTTDICKDSNKHTEEWIREWQVMFSCFLTNHLIGFSLSHSIQSNHVFPESLVGHAPVPAGQLAKRDKPLRGTGDKIFRNLRVTFGKSWKISLEKLLV